MIIAIGSHPLEKLEDFGNWKSLAKGRCFIGTSGWIYPHWRGVFYPEGLPPSEWFAYYAGHLHTVEINNSFYHLPSEKAFRAWREQSPPGFLYSVKANRFITHMKKLKAPQEALDKFLPRARLLGPHLGPILYQLPPHWHWNLERLAAFLRVLPKDIAHSVEFRDRSWLRQETFDLLKEEGVAFCIISMPGFDCPIVATSSFVYIRMHGSTDLYGDKYSYDELESWARKIRAFLDEGRDVFVYFNNDAYGYAVQNAIELRELLGVSPGV